jgi:phosphoglycolate phosphatase
MAFDWKNIRTVVWDLDGTLVDSAEDIATAVNLVLTDNNLSTLTVAQVRQMIGNGAAKLLDRAFEAANGSQGCDRDAAYQRFLTHYEKHCCDNTAFYPGIANVVSTCAEKGITQGVCTNKPHRMAELILSHLQIRSCFSSVIGGDSTEFRKPHAQPLLTCMEQLNASAGQTLMIGDSAADVGVARAAGVAVAVLPWGYTPTGAADLGADVVIEDAAALLQVLPV